MSLIISIKLDQQFINFAKFGDTKLDGKSITLKQVDRWFQQAQLFDRKLTMTDTGLAFFKFRSKTINYTNFLAFLEDLATEKNIDPELIKQKLMECGPPGTKSVPSTASAADVKKKESLF